MFERGQINLGNILGTTIAVIFAVTFINWINSKRADMITGTGGVTPVPPKTTPTIAS